MFELIFFCANKKRDERFGEALFTHTGMSGPVILDMSKKIGELLEDNESDIFLFIDFKPALEHKVLDKRIQRDIADNSNKQFRNVLKTLLPSSLIPVVIQLMEIDAEKKCNQVTKEDRKRLIRILKGLQLHVRSLGGFNKAIITSGGVSLKEIDPKTMRSRIIDNLYFAGEILDLDGPTGGYNLQVCWSTGYCAGENSYP